MADNPRGHDEVNICRPVGFVCSGSLNHDEPILIFCLMPSTKRKGTTAPLLFCFLDCLSCFHNMYYRFARANR